MATDPATEPAATEPAATAPATDAETPVSTGVADTVTPDSSPASSAEVATVDANTATVDQIAAARAANGVSNADRWAREVEEYRPYDTSDPDLGGLRDELAKYNPGAATLEAIIASLRCERDRRPRRHRAEYRHRRRTSARVARPRGGRSRCHRIELAMLRHWGTFTRNIPWAVLAVTATAIVGVALRPRRWAVRAARITAVAVTLATT